MEGKMKEAQTLAMLRNMLTILSSMARDADLQALAFLIGMAELEAAQAAVHAKRKAKAKH
jgi:hypothetical protein